METNLHNYLQGIADAIKEKTGDTTINAQDFASKIASIEVGGGSEPTIELERKDVNFYDYEGTLLFSYTLAEAQALTELPTPKGHEGLVFQGWNWDYEDVITLDYPMDIGAMYVTDDGKTRLYLEVEDEEGVDIRLAFQQYNNDIEVDWGDDSEQESSATTNTEIKHHYAKGSYILTLRSKNNHQATLMVPSAAGLEYNTLGNVGDASSFILRKVELGENMSIGSYAFHSMSNLESVTIPKNATATGSNAYWGCISLKHMNLSPATSALSTSSFYGCAALKTITIANGLTSIANNVFVSSGIQHLRVTDKVTINLLARTEIEEFSFSSKYTAITAAMFDSCTHLKYVKLGDNITSIGSNAFINCVSLKRVDLNEGLKTIESSAFYTCISLDKLIFPSTISTIGSQAFNQCSKMRVWDFSRCTSIPTLMHQNAFTLNTQLGKKIIVPDALYEEWITASNWINLSAFIAKVSDYDSN